MQDVPAIIIAAKSLPKNAMVEVQVLAHANRLAVVDNEDESAVSNQVVTERSHLGHFTVRTRKINNRSSHSIVLGRNSGRVGHC